MPSDRCSPATSWSADRQSRFLVHLAETGNVSEAAREAGVARSYARSRRQRDASFAALWDEALEIAFEALEAEARRRAVEGVDQPLVSGGKLVVDEDGSPVTIRRYSDRLLEFLLKTRRPRSAERTEDSELRTLTDAERAARIASLAEFEVGEPEGEQT